MGLPGVEIDPTPRASIFKLSRPSLLKIIFCQKYKLINLSKNFGKGYAVKQGAKESLGDYILLQDADLELDLKDSKEIYEIISSDQTIDCIFGSRYLSGKLKKHNYF